MRVKHTRQRRKLLTYFRAAHGFRPPFSVLLDGTSIQAALNHGVSLAEALPQLLSGKVKLLVPKAAVAELHALGRNFAAAAKFARRLQIIAPEGGGHGSDNADTDAAASSSAGAAADAVVALVTGGNPRHYFVLTEDRELRQRLSTLQTVPLLRFARGRLVLEAPGRHDTQGATDDVREQPPGVGKATGAMSSAAGGAQKRARPEEGDSSQARQDHALQPADPARKRRRVKEPNPLSVKKKKKTISPGNATPHGSGSAGGGGRRRHRKQHGGRGSAGAAAGGQDVGGS